MTNDGMLEPYRAPRKASIINKAMVKKIAHAHGKRVNAGFLSALELHIHNKIEAACKQHNGSSKTLDREVATFVGIK